MDQLQHLYWHVLYSSSYLATNEGMLEGNICRKYLTMGTYHEVQKQATSALWVSSDGPGLQHQLTPMVLNVKSTSIIKNMSLTVCTIKLLCTVLH